MRDVASGWASGFDRFASRAARLTGHAGAFTASALLVVIWAVSGPLFHFSDTWQLVINTGTTVLTFLMVFVIQNTINRDSAAMHLKVDELLRVTQEARNALVGAEVLSGKELERLQDEEHRAARSEEQTAREGVEGPSASGALGGVSERRGEGRESTDSSRRS
jgi:low affinity Fe/Cu permease